MSGLSDLTIGKVVEFFDTLANPPKYKMSVIVGISKDGSDIATVYINSNINAHKLGSPELMRLQYEIQPDEKARPFLSHTSYIDCSSLQHRFPASLQNSISDAGKIAGSLPQDDLKQVIDLIKSAETIFPYYLSLFNIN